MKIWIVSDNIADCPFVEKNIAKKIIKEAEPFFINELYLGDCTQFFLIESNPIIDCLREIWLLNTNDWIKLKVFEGLRKFLGLLLYMIPVLSITYVGRKVGQKVSIKREFHSLKISILLLFSS